VELIPRGERLLKVVVYGLLYGQFFAERRFESGARFLKTGGTMKFFSLVLLATLMGLNQVGCTQKKTR
jgi:hypothetical protein